MKIVKTFFTIIILTFFTAFSANAQCKGFVKKQCMPKMNPFIPNGQMNSSTLLAGDNADLSMTFYSGQNYRILVCAQEVLGKVQFKLKDANNNVLFDSKEHDFTDYWDFNVATTQQLSIEINVPPSDSENKIIPSGCVSIIVGFKK